ncbi:MAG: alpha/beta hydrolase, partial [Bacteroidetes bacterium]|nr:alpha/beta hydrolase [Bacteroidota bacterium]
MRKLYSFFAIVMAMATTSVSAQTRYLDEVFTGVNVESNVTYGMNATVLYYSVLGQAVPEALKMDIYSPAGDMETNRPLMLFFHTGNFLPHPQNGGTGGMRTDSSAVEICSRFARMGYVVASCDYRLGWNPIDTSQEGRVYTLINAAYRGVQDSRTAARFFRKSVAEMGNMYGVDTTRIVAFGQGTGGYISLASATLDVYGDVVLPKFTRVVQTPNGPMPLPMVLESVNGNIDGTTWGTTAGFVAPGTEDTLCYPNHTGYSSSIQACVN